MFTSDDFKGGAGCFTWFADRDGLFDFLKYYLPFFQVDDLTEEELEARKKYAGELSELQRLFTANEASKEQVIAFINIADIFSQSALDWIGQMDELSTGQHWFEKKIRSDYYWLLDSDIKGEHENNNEDFVKGISLQVQ